jgi:hypothetical protein
MKKWSDLEPSEKGMVLIVAILIIGIALSWGRISEGMKHGVNHYLHPGKESAK